MTMPDTPDSAFRRITREMSGVDCGCACHTGTGYDTACVHCQPPSAEAVCAHDWCGKPESDRQHLSAGDLPNPYMSHHLFKQPEEAVPGALEAALSEYNESVRHDGTCGYSFDARTPCSCGKARIADALIAAARTPGPAGGEALEELRGWYEQLIGDRKPDTPLPWRTSKAGTMLIDALNPNGVPLAVRMDPANAEFVARALMFTAAAARAFAAAAPAAPGGES